MAPLHRRLFFLFINHFTSFPYTCSVTRGSAGFLSFLLSSISWFNSYARINRDYVCYIFWNVLIDLCIRDPKLHSNQVCVDFRKQCRSILYNKKKSIKKKIDAALGTMRRARKREQFRNNNSSSRYICRISRNIAMFLQLVSSQSPPCA